MALSRTLLDSVYENDGSVTTDSVSPASGELLVALVSIIRMDAGSGLTNLAVTDSGSLTWTQRASIGVAGGDGWWGNAAAIYTAVSTGGSRTVTASQSDPSRVGLTLLSYSGHDTSSPVGATMSQASGTGYNSSLSAALSATSASDSEVAAVIMTGGFGASGSITAGTGWTELANLNADPGRFQSQVYEGAKANAEWDLVNGSYFGYAACAIEIVAEADGDPELFITASFTEPNETLSGAAAVTVTGSATFTEPNESVSSQAAVLNTINAAFTEPNETLSATVAGATMITAAFTEPNETLSSEVNNPIVLVGLQTAEPNEALTSAVNAIVGLNLSATEPNETLASLAGVLVTLELDVTEPNERLNSYTHHGDTPPSSGASGHRGINIRSIGIGI